MPEEVFFSPLVLLVHEFKGLDSLELELKQVSGIEASQY